MSIRSVVTWGSAALLAVALGVATSASASVSRYEVRADGLACPFCAYGLEKKLKALPGVADVHVDLEGGVASFDVADGTLLPPGPVEKAVRDAGFTPRGITARASGTVRGSGDDLSLDVGDGLTLLLRGGEALDRLRSLVREGHLEVVVTGMVTASGEAWQLSVGDASERLED